MYIAVPVLIYVIERLVIKFYEFYHQVNVIKVLRSASHLSFLGGLAVQAKQVLLVFSDFSGSSI